MKKLFAIILVLLLAFCLTGTSFAAGQVTDTLTIKVGYYGMESEDYVEVASYHWSELYSNLPLYQNAYSFFRVSSDGTYYTVIDSAYGFYISDLLDYAGIYSGDIQSFQFFTQDQSVGYFTSFTYADLFYTQRYYFNDLAAHIHPVYDEEGNFLYYDATEAWGDCFEVQPMLALEDSWVTYEIGTEHTSPNYSSLGTGNRFRLLFGQSSPTESRTNQSAKYTHTIFVTLNGAPVISDGLPEIDGTIGSHTVQFDVSVSNSALLSALSQLLQVSSSDESILEITGITVTPNMEYSDLATVILTYTVHQEGNVSLSVGFGGTTITQSPEIVTQAKPTQPTTPSSDNTEPTQPQNPDPTTKPIEAEGTDPTQQPDQGPNSNANTTPSEANILSSEEPSTQPIEMQSQTPDSSVVPQESLQSNKIYLLDSELAQRLREKSEDGVSDDKSELQQNVTALTIAEKNQWLTVLLTGLEAVLICLLGAVIAMIYYCKERKQAE